jgi:F0F1-type ATP synthase assembly protein I
MYLARTDHWYLERIIWLIAGIVVLAGTCLGLFVHRYWFALPILAGCNMIIFALSGFCPMAVIINRLLGIEGLTARREGQGG